MIDTSPAWNSCSAEIGERGDRQRPERQRCTGMSGAPRRSMITMAMVGTTPINTIGGTAAAVEPDLQRRAGPS